MTSNDQVTPWIKAKRSASEGQCVEMRRRGDAVEVRDSKNPDGDRLRLTPETFAAWLSFARSGKADEL